MTPPPNAGAEQHHREWLAEIGLERSELFPHRMVALTERDQVLKSVRLLEVQNPVGVDECAKRRNVVDVQVTIPALAMGLAVEWDKHARSRTVSPGFRN